MALEMSGFFEILDNIYFKRKDTRVSRIIGTIQVVLILIAIIIAVFFAVGLVVFLVKAGPVWVSWVFFGSVAVAAIHNVFWSH